MAQGVWGPWPGVGSQSNLGPSPGPPSPPPPSYSRLRRLALRRWRSAGTWGGVWTTKLKDDLLSDNLFVDAFGTGPLAPRTWTPRPGPVAATGGSKGGEGRKSQWLRRRTLRACPRVEAGPRSEGNLYGPTSQFLFELCFREDGGLPSRTTTVGFGKPGKMLNGKMTTPKSPTLRPEHQRTQPLRLVCGGSWGSTYLSPSTPLWSTTHN